MIQKVSKKSHVTSEANGFTSSRFDMPLEDLRKVMRR